ncbi:MAG: hypothetical protein IJ366_09165 [Clostridia bacterium]|nr:hypothetical protein [Clostridia bacterium]
MNLKTSFCNKSIIKSDFKRLWWIPALHTLAILLLSVYNFIDRYYNNSFIGAQTYAFAHSTLYNYSAPIFVLALIIPVILGVFLFSYLQTGKSAAFAHSIPVLRKTQYISHIISGVIMFMIPLVVNGAILLIMRADSGFATTYKVSHLFIVLGISALYSILSFSGAVAVSMITANVVAAIIFTYVFAVLPIACESFLAYFLDTQLYGWASDGTFLLEKLYLGPVDLLSAKNILLYTVITLALVIAGYFFYKIRSIENHSEVVAFPKLRPVFVYGAGICCGCIGFAYFNSLWDISSALALIPLGILGIVIATMIVKKSFRVFSVYKPILIYSAAILAVFGVLKFDLTGFEARVPVPEDVSGITFETYINNDSGFYYNDVGERMYPDKTFTPYITDETVILKVAALHTQLAANKDGIHQGRRITIEYDLKNGGKLKREYIADFANHKELLEPICESDIIRQAYFPILRDNERTIIEMDIRDARYNDVKAVNKEIYEELLTALKTDLMNADYSEFAGRMETMTWIRMEYTEPSHYENGTPVPESELANKRETYYIRPSYVNTIGVLEKYGLMTPWPKAEDIEKVGINYYRIYRNEKPVSVAVETASSINDVHYDMVIDNPEQIRELYEYVEGLFVIYSYDMDVTFFLRDGSSFSTSFGYDDPHLPEFLKSNDITE